MRYALSNLLLLCFLFLSCSVLGQSVFHNDGNIVHTTPGSIVYVSGPVNCLNDGQISNGGTIYFDGDWTSNTATSDDAAQQDGLFHLYGIQQNVLGHTNVRLPNVELASSVNLLRQVKTDVEVTQTMQVTDAEWATGSNVLFVSNSDPLAIDRVTGFISNDTIGAALIRNTNQDADYLFPVGSNGAAHRNPNPRYRPVILIPSGGNTANQYAVRFGNVNATNDRTDGGNGFDLNKRDLSLTSINQKFYYMVNRTTGTAPVTMEFYYDLLDGKFSTVAQLESDTTWRDADGGIIENATPKNHTADLDRIAILRDHDNFELPYFTEAGADADNDGIADKIDLDGDNDGIANIDEVPSDPYADEDGDGLYDYLDGDFSNCGGLVNGICRNFDFDLDGLPNHLDLDSDADGITDIIEAGGIDTDFDAQVDYPVAGDVLTMLDIDNDGFADANDHLDGGRATNPSDEVTSGTPWPQEDRDNDGLVNFQDIDSDGDGIVDFIEGQLTTLYNFPAEFDADHNGIDNAFDYVENSSSYRIDPVNTDGTDQPDYLDLNSDNERTSDLAEGYDSDGDGLLDAPRTPTGVDSDGDGLDDRFDVLVITVTPKRNATNNNSAAFLFPNFQNPASDERDWRELDCSQQVCRPVATNRNP